MAATMVVTRFCGARIKATIGTKAKLYPYDFALDYDENHYAAARLAADDMPIIGGRLPNGDYAWAIL